MYSLQLKGIKNSCGGSPPSVIQDSEKDIKNSFRRSPASAIQDSVQGCGGIHTPSIQDLQKSVNYRCVEGPTPANAILDLDKDLPNDSSSSIPSLLKDLVTATELEALLGPTCIRLLQVLVYMKRL